MADVVLVVLRRPEMASALLHAAQWIAHLMGQARLSVLAVREPIQVSALAAEALIEEAQSVVRARQQEHQRVAVLHATFEAWVGDTGADARWIEEEGSAPAIISEAMRGPIR